MARFVQNLLRRPGPSGSESERAAQDARETTRSHQPWWTRVGLPFWLSLGWLVLISLSAILADILPIDDPLSTNLDTLFMTPLSEGHLLGTDAVGRDMLSRAIHGARISLQLAFTAPFLSLLVGLVLGLSAGYFRGRVDTAVSVFTDSILAFPNIVGVMVILFFFGASLPVMILALAFFGIPAEVRVARANTILFSGREFVMAARALGASNLRIMVRELLPNVIVPMLSLVLFGMSIVIIIEGSLAFLGVGFPPPTPSWGKMIADGFEDISRAPHVTLVPAAVMFLTILSLNMIGDSLRALTDVKASSL
ncbi:MAG: ABC transporter permease [Paracoccaceae bacterium]|nr:ABC transporter permease [Paracoccaceae bacterium]